MKTETLTSNKSISSDGPKYWAFICYRPVDQKAARALHGALETYRIPIHLVGKTTHRTVVPKRAFPVFLDSEELPLKGRRTEDIQFALEQSRNLIVICSESPGDSQEADEQLRYFRSLGRGDRIIVLIVGGSGSGPDLSTEGLWPATQLRGVEATSGGAIEPRLVRNGKRATMEIVAHLTGVAFDELNQREMERTMRRVQILLTGIAILLLLFGLLCIELYRRGNLAAESERALIESDRELHAVKAELERIKRDSAAKKKNQNQP